MNMTPDKDKSTANTELEMKRRIIEGLIFARAEPTSAKLISKTVGDIQNRQIENAVKELNEIYERNNLSFRIRKIAEGYQFHLLPDVSEFALQMFKKERKMRLSKAALETLAIVAYKQPVSKSEIEYIRGVASDGVLHNLLEKNLISISGRSEAAGRPLLYSATNEFLKFFGMESFKDLPKLTEIEELMRDYQQEETPLDPGANANETENDAEKEVSAKDGEDETILDLEISDDATGSDGEGANVASSDDPSEPELVPAAKQD